MITKVREKTCTSRVCINNNCTIFVRLYLKILTFLFVLFIHVFTYLFSYLLIYVPTYRHISYMKRKSSVIQTFEKSTSCKRKQNVLSVWRFRKVKVMIAYCTYDNGRYHGLSRCIHVKKRLVIPKSDYYDEIKVWVKIWVFPFCCCFIWSSSTFKLNTAISKGSNTTMILTLNLLHYDSYIYIYLIIVFTSSWISAKFEVKLMLFLFLFTD
jgi:hypothetical protein